MKDESTIWDRIVPNQNIQIQVGQKLKKFQLKMFFSIGKTKIIKSLKYNN
jgi:hypothetical protein